MLEIGENTPTLESVASDLVFGILTLRTANQVACNQRPRGRREPDPPPRTDLAVERAAVPS